MDFIERLFHVSPDGGSGLTELLYLLVLLVVLLLVFRTALWRWADKTWRALQRLLRR